MVPHGLQQHGQGLVRPAAERAVRTEQQPNPFAHASETAAMPTTASQHAFLPAGRLHASELLPCQQGAEAADCRLIRTAVHEELASAERATSSLSRYQARPEAVHEGMAGLASD